MHILLTPIEYLKGVGPSRALVLKKELKIFNFSDLLYYYPFRYIDRTVIHKISELHSDMKYVQLKGRVRRFEEKGQKKSKRLIGLFEDESGAIELVWFKGLRWISSSIKINVEYMIFGKPTSFQDKMNIIHPEIELLKEDKVVLNRLQPVYSTTESLTSKGLTSRGIGKLTKLLLDELHNTINETLSEDIITKFRLLSREEALFNIHFPKNTQYLNRARKRLKFEELFFLQFHLLKMKRIKNKKYKGHVFAKIDYYFNTYYNHSLPFDLTNAQKRVIKDIRGDLNSGRQMNRLLQGDVGSGKTLVALMSILITLDNKYQACLMVPTEILAQQHYHTISNHLENLDLDIALLTGSTTQKNRKNIYDRLEKGKINILLGTHAILEDKVKFKNLGLVVIDEQHRFGVAQRAKLWRKNTSPPHVLIMTATPIPRTLSMTLYGDLDVSVINELPPGRKKIKTIWRSYSSRLRVNQFIREKIQSGRQVYVVYPLIEESETLDYNNLIEGFHTLSREFPLPEYQVSVVHGQMRNEDKEYEMKRFIEGKTNIMVATTVIEVGVDIPNATVMIIESAERFGLSQLHQLRGRVGRGAHQSYCILLSGFKISDEGRLRLETMVNTNDGFKISEVDLKLRGPGDIMGTKQSGILNLSIADLLEDKEILEYAREEAINLIKEDEDLKKDSNKRIAKSYQSYAKEKGRWSRIS